MAALFVNTIHLQCEKRIRSESPLPSNAAHNLSIWPFHLVFCCLLNETSLYCRRHFLFLIRLLYPRRLIKVQIIRHETMCTNAVYTDIRNRKTKQQQQQTSENTNIFKINTEQVKEAHFLSRANEQ